MIKGVNDRVRVLAFHGKPGVKWALHEHPEVVSLGDYSVRNVVVGFAVFMFALATVSSAAPGAIELSVKPSEESPTSVVVEARNTSDEPVSLGPFSAFELRAEGQKEVGFWARFSFRGDHRATHRNRAAVPIPKGEVVRADINLTALGWSLLPRSNWWTGYLRSVVPPGRYLLVVTVDSDNGQRFESAPVLWVAKP